MADQAHHQQAAQKHHAAVNQHLELLRRDECLPSRIETDAAVAILLPLRFGRIPPPAGSRAAFALVH
ncbi:hypothetical protein IE4872_CH02087 [Rhizobium gallicum]|uniref:Uncharacterized protein n=1 Tax=Rhizobium gallicum TaxID=56730 RepID=A0A1L5NIH0_9HYPH|nr:hypothetical protein IE4872_CH02087 [Rhizobium gallicum]